MRYVSVDGVDLIHLISITPIQTALLVKFGWEVKLNADYKIIQQSRIPGTITDYCEDVVVYGEDYFWITRADEYSERDIERRLKEEEENLQWYVDWIGDKMKEVVDDCDR
jgi:GTP cyclohydrolase FolE2